MAGRHQDHPNRKIGVMVLAGSSACILKSLQDCDGKDIRIQGMKLGTQTFERLSCSDL